MFSSVYLYIGEFIANIVKRAYSIFVFNNESKSTEQHRRWMAFVTRTDAYYRMVTESCSSRNLHASRSIVSIHITGMEFSDLHNPYWLSLQDWNKYASPSCHDLVWDQSVESTFTSHSLSSRKARRYFVVRRYTLQYNKKLKGCCCCWMGEAEFVLFFWVEAPRRKVNRASPPKKTFLSKTPPVNLLR